MFWFKCCPRCLKGDLFENGDIYGAYTVCLRCGHYLTDKETAKLLDTCLTGSMPAPIRTTNGVRATLSRVS